MTFNDFNPNDPARPDAGIYGLPHNENSAGIIVIPVPWEVTVSYRGGTFRGPEAIRSASMQVDLHHHDFPELWRQGIWMDSFPEDLAALHLQARSQAAVLIRMLENGTSPADSPEMTLRYREIEQAGDALNDWVKSRVRYWKEKDKVVGLVGGDHSIPLGYFQCLDDLKEDFGILVIDAHMDLREAYEGFRYSHASIFYNALMLRSVSKIVQVGVRDYCKEEADRVRSLAGRVRVFYDRDLHRQLFQGKSWKEITGLILQDLPEKVYISFDIDGLDPALCPGTGTPVPGGPGYEQIIYLLNELKASGREIVGFDLSEVAPGGDEWDGNVGARILYHLCGVASRK